MDQLDAIQRAQMDTAAANRAFVALAKATPPELLEAFDRELERRKWWRPKNWRYCFWRFKNGLPL